MCEVPHSSTCSLRTVGKSSELMRHHYAYYRSAEMAKYWHHSYCLQNTERDVMCLLMELLTAMLQKRDKKKMHCYPVGHLRRAWSRMRNLKKKCIHSTRCRLQWEKINLDRSRFQEGQWEVVSCLHDLISFMVSRPHGDPDYEECCSRKL